MNKLVEQISKLHKKIEQESSNNFEITIYDQKNQEHVIIGDLDKRNEYIVYDMIQWSSLNGVYNSIDDFDKTVNLFKKRYKLKQNIFIDANDGTVCVGHGKINEIGKVKINNK